MTAEIAPAAPWARPAPYDASAASLAEHVAAIGEVMAGRSRLWLGAGDPPSSLPAGFEDTVLVVPTSGSTGTAKSVAHPLRTLLASQDATAAALGGHGFWLPLLPPTHIAGVQVIARAHRTAQVLGLDAAALPEDLPDLRGHFDAAALVRAAAPALEQAEAAGLPAFTSLVPTQLARIVTGATGDDARARALLRRFAGVLVGGAATPGDVLARARGARIAVRTTYGSSETAGGCVYDAAPLAGVHLLLADAHDGEGRLLVDSPTLATGYLGADGAGVQDGFAEVDGRRVLVTSDLARIAEDGSLTVLGRADDVIVTGGRKVLPQDVERAAEASLVLRGLVTGCAVVGVPDPEWGQRVEALVTLGAGAAPEEATALVRSALRIAELPSWSIPKRVHVVAELPLRGIGKIDRAAAAALARSRAEEATTAVDVGDDTAPGRTSTGERRA
ncbi:AMP-binding protein [Brachybacterium sp. SGAir0954]|uniref:AMP-binding enzyme n=1 Tax=Brachybacterium sp. SGAir0954 TaxID=2571029 RepID=UPI001F0D867A|nr:AMP-binding protein [Brachybacterium sp. SGAir0954]